MKNKSIAPVIFIIAIIIVTALSVICFNKERMFHVVFKSVIEVPLNYNVASIETDFNKTHGKEFDLINLPQKEDDNTFSFIQNKKYLFQIIEIHNAEYLDCLMYLRANHDLFTGVKGLMMMYEFKKEWLINKPTFCFSNDSDALTVKNCIPVPEMQLMKLLDHNSFYVNCFNRAFTNESCYMLCVSEQ